MADIFDEMTTELENNLILGNTVMIKCCTERAKNVHISPKAVEFYTKMLQYLICGAGVDQAHRGCPVDYGLKRSEIGKCNNFRDCDACWKNAKSVMVER